MSVSLSPLFNNDQAVVDANGDPRTGAHLHTYLAGGSTPATTYKTSAGSGGAAHTNPIILDANGLPPAPIWLTQGASYKFVLAPSTDTTPPVSAILTIDNITGINDVADVVATEWTPSAMAATYVSSTSFTVTGDQTTALHTGRRIKITSNGTTVYGAIIYSVYTSLTTVYVLLDSGSLASPLTALSYGIVSAANTSHPYFSRDQQCCRLVYGSATLVSVVPQDGNTIWIYTATSGWALRSIVSGWLTANTSVYVNGVAGQSLAASTTYFVYLFDLSNALTLDFSTTAPAVDATSGLKIKTGDPTRLLIGMVRTNASTPGQFQTPALVLSWYKRRGIKVSAALSTTRTTNSGSIVEINAEIQAKFLTWAEEAVAADFAGYASNDSLAQSCFTHITLDGLVTVISGPIVATTPIVSAPHYDNASLSGVATMAEGYHYATIGVLVSGGIGTWSGGTLFVTTQG